MMGSANRVFATVAVVGAVVLGLNAYRFLADAGHGDIEIPQSPGDATNNSSPLAAFGQSSAETAVATRLAGTAQTPPERDEVRTSRAAREKMSGPVAELAAAGGSGDTEIIVRYNEHPELFDDELVASIGGEVTRRYSGLQMRAVRIPAASLESLALQENVAWLSLDERVSAMSVASRQASGQPGPNSVNSVYHGNGVGIAILDSGVSSHADLGADIRQYSFLNGAYPKPKRSLLGLIRTYNDGPREDAFGHGTHVAGILVGSGWDSRNEFQGASKGANVLSLRVLDANGGGSMSDVIAALDWLLEYGRQFDIRVVSLSLGKGVSESNETDPLVLAVERLWDAGMVVIVAAGNYGRYGSMTVTSPGNSRKVITVGSLTENGTGLDFADDYVSTFSSTGPTLMDHVLKPDVVAPGNRLIAAIPGRSRLAQQLPERVHDCTPRLLICGSEYLEISGTSMATPLVGATVALMLQKDPMLTPATVKARLMRSARKFDADATSAGAGLLDIDAALDDLGIVSGQALSPLMHRDEAGYGILVEDTSVLWGGAEWNPGYIYNGGFTWYSGYNWTDPDGVDGNGYMWTDRSTWAKGELWDDSEIWSEGYMWTDNVRARTDSPYELDTGVSTGDGLDLGLWIETALGLLLNDDVLSIIE
jgi:serine protease AprX